MLDSNHTMNTFSTLPFKAKFFWKKVDSLSKNCYWRWCLVGNECPILSGTNIGKGAEIGAWVVVSGKIPFYAIVVGNPGRIIRYRFENDIIEQIKK